MTVEASLSLEAILSLDFAGLLAVIRAYVQFHEKVSVCRINVFMNVYINVDMNVYVNFYANVYIIKLLTANDIAGGSYFHPGNLSCLH